MYTEKYSLLMNGGAMGEKVIRSEIKADLCFEEPATHVRDRLNIDSIQKYFENDGYTLINKGSHPRHIIGMEEGTLRTLSALIQQDTALRSHVFVTVSDDTNVPRQELFNVNALHAFFLNGTLPAKTGMLPLSIPSE